MYTWICLHVWMLSNKCTKYTHQLNDQFKIISQLYWNFRWIWCTKGREKGGIKQRKEEKGENRAFYLCLLDVSARKSLMQNDYIHIQYVPSSTWWWNQLLLSLELFAGFECWFKRKAKKEKKKKAVTAKNEQCQRLFMCMRVSEWEGENEQRMYILHIDIENRACSTLLFAM